MFPSDGRDDGSDFIFFAKKREFQNKANNWDRSRRNTIKMLEDLAKELDIFQRDMESKKRKLAMAGIVGGGLTLVGIGLSVVTAGASLGIAGMGMTLTGAGCGVASGVGGFYQQGKEKTKNKEIVEKADRAVKEFTELSDEFTSLLAELQELAKSCKIDLQFQEFHFEEKAALKTSAGIVVCSGAMVTALSGLGLLITNAGSVASQAVNPGTLAVVSLVGNAAKYIGVTDKLSKFASGVSGLRAFVSATCDVAGSGLRLVNAAGKVARVAGGGLAVLSVGLDFRAYVESSIKMNSDNPSEVAKKIRQMASELSSITKADRI